jgi:hypothetical protein
MEINKNGRGAPGGPYQKHGKPLSENNQNKQQH